MVKESALPAGLGKKLLIGGSATLGAGGAGAGGYFLGKRQGAEQTANIMATQFSRANQLENQQIARQFFLRGLQHNPNFKKESGMDKQAVLREVYTESFNDELEKIALNVPGGASIAKAIGALGTSGKALLRHGKQTGKNLNQMLKGRKGPEAMRKLYSGSAKGSAGKMLREGGLALGVGGTAVGAGGVGAGMAMGGKKKK